MGLLGEVGAQELEEAMKPREYLVFPEGEYPVLVDTVEATAEGKKGPYIPMRLSAINEQTGETTTVFYNMSLSAKARPVAIKTLLGLGVDPNSFDDPTQLQGCQGRAYLEVGLTNKGKERNEVRWFVLPTA